MLVLCYGIPKSGSTLAFEMVTGILQTAGYDQPFICNDRLMAAEINPLTTRNFIDRVTRKNISEALDKIGTERMVAVKTHSDFPDDLFLWLEGLQQERQLQIVASYRDPRDNSLSALDAGQRARKKGAGAFMKIENLDIAAGNIKKRTEHFRKWAALRGTLRLNYETVAFSPDDAIDAIEKALNVKSNRQQVKTYAFKEARTQKNMAKKDRHKDELSEEQNAQLSQMFRQFIKQACERDNQVWYDRQRERIIRQTRPGRENKQ